jgi:prepilin-type N-terminal cleavage/methylation domain-containing protein
MKENKNKIFFQKGFTLMEVVVSIGIISILLGVVFGIYTLIINQIIAYRDKTTVSYLASQYMEVARNLPYSKVGTLQGNPNGNLADLPNALTLNFGGNDYQVYYAVSFVDDPADGTILANTDLAPTDYKQIKLYIKNTKTNTVSNFLTNVSPKGLENSISGGALNILVMDAVGQPISGATIHITNTETIPTYDLTRTSDANGNWIEVGLPGSANSYHIEVSKNGYSSDQTYPITISNPNPTKPDSTILIGQVTQISFSIDLVSNLNFLTLDQACEQVSMVGLGVRGSKIIGTSPDIYKFDNIYSSNAVGQVPLSNIEWDTYTPTITSPSYMIYGSFPIQQVSLLPNTSQNFTLIIGPSTPYSFLAIVKDSSTGNAVQGVSVNLQSTTANYDSTKITGGSIWSQQSWLGGSGQVDFLDITKYLEDNGGISVSGLPSGARLVKVGDDYVAFGTLTSSTFDTGTEETVYTTLTWQPTSQDPATIIKFQVATNNDNETWNFTGPDGSESSYYEVPGTSINLANNGNRYVRYKAFLSTTDVSKTPVLTSINVNYISGCYTPGQVIFTDTPIAEDYVVRLSMTGYITQTIIENHVEGYVVSNISLVAGINPPTNTAPSTPSSLSDGASSVLMPTVAGNNVTFSANATDNEGDKYYLAICKTNVVTSHPNSAPTCDGGDWCISSITNSGYQATCDYETLNSDTGSHAWYAFACDYDDSSICSSVSQGTGNNGSPFYVVPNWLLGWNYRNKITISHSNLTSNISNFPLYIKVAESGGLSTNIGANVLSNGYDIRFTGSDKITPLSFERESFSVESSNLTADFWVKIPEISDLIDTDIYIYYGKSNAVDGQDTANVWDSNYKGVWHLKELGTESIDDYKDSTSIGSNSTNTLNQPVQALGKIGKAQNFDNSDKINTSSILHNIGTGNFTYQAWVNPSTLSGPSTYRSIMSNGNKSPVLYTREASLRAYFTSDLSSDATLSENLWQHVVFNRSGTDILNFYKNGILTSSSLTSSSSLGNSGIMTIAQNGDSSQNWSGLIDEVRLSDIARSANWIKFEYYNISSANNETTFANQEIYEE